MTTEVLPPSGSSFAASAPEWRAWILPLAALAALYVAIPLYASNYLIEAIALPFLALSLAALGLNLLTGYCGQLSLGSAALMAVGAYAAYNFNLRVEGLSLPILLLLAGATGAFIGLIFGLPSLRLRGFYLAVSSLAAQFFVQWALTKFGWFSNNNPSGVITAPKLSFLGLTFDSPAGRYLFSLTVVSLIALFVWRLVNGPAGKNFIAVRDNQTAAQVIGTPVLRTKMLAFGLSSAIIAIAGVLWSFAYLRTVEPAGFNLDRSFQILFIIIIGGLGTIRGAFLGAAVMVVLPLALARFGAWAFGGAVGSGTLELVQRILIGAVIILFLIKEPSGLSALLDRFARRLRISRA